MSEQPTETPEAPASPDSEQAAPLPAEPVAAEAPQETAPDMSEQVQLLQQRLDRYEQQNQAQEDPAPTDPVDGLLNAHFGDEQDEYYEDVEDPYAPEHQEQDPVAQELAAIKAHLNKQEYDRRVGEIKALAEDYPELLTAEGQQKIAQELAPDMDQYGEQILTDPRHIKRALIVMKAEAASAKETPAEEARHRGASLESDAGARADDGADDYKSRAEQEILNAGPPQSAFG